ncbi:uncharacterized protein LOC113473950 isoform X2 [Diaphorina citri]|uniref:Uncharacterized protein LOC113473950 isoform X1 n=1 Tax=Diaphorina citri TaxID=121845 RepID=A0A3Q0JLT1_DIACI|nr:uncharacterized protein LOC113473950 isoform X1 [Diaphorina citri]XP_026689294.1 uncharacterized protein LOC113473950 isoform X2 [Diaphorina citri]
METRKASKSCWNQKKFPPMPKKENDFELVKVTQRIINHGSKTFKPRDSRRGKEFKYQQLQMYTGRVFPDGICPKKAKKKKKPLKVERIAIASIKEDMRYRKKKRLESPINMFRLMSNDYGNTFLRRQLDKIERCRMAKLEQRLRIKDRERRMRGAFQIKGVTGGIAQIPDNIWKP